MAEFQLKVHVPRCGICAQAHDYVFEVRTVRLFGGPGEPEESVKQQYDVLVTCPATGTMQTLTISVPRPAGEKLLKVRQVRQ